MDLEFALDGLGFSITLRLEGETSMTVAECAAKAVLAYQMFFPSATSHTVAQVMLGDEVVPPFADLATVLRERGGETRALLVGHPAAITRSTSQPSNLGRATRSSSVGGSFVSPRLRERRLPARDKEKKSGGFGKLFSRKKKSTSNETLPAAAADEQQLTVTSVLQDQEKLPVLLQVATEAFCPSDVEAAALMYQHGLAVRDGDAPRAQRIANNLVEDFLGEDVTIAISLGAGAALKDRVAAGEWNDEHLFSAMLAELSLSINMNLWDAFLAALAAGGTSADNVICLVCEERSALGDHRCASCNYLTCPSCILVAKTATKVKLLCLNCVKCRVCNKNRVEKDHFCHGCEKQTCAACLSVVNENNGAVALCKDCGKTETGRQRAQVRSSSSASSQWTAPQMLDEFTLGAWLLGAPHGKRKRKFTEHFVECRMGALLLYPVKLKGSITLDSQVHALSVEGDFVELRDKRDKLFKLKFEGEDETEDFMQRCRLALKGKIGHGAIFYYAANKKQQRFVLQLRGALIKLWRLLDRREAILRKAELETDEEPDSEYPFQLLVASAREPQFRLGSRSPLEVIHLMQTLRSASDGDPDLSVPLDQITESDFEHIRLLAEGSVPVDPRKIKQPSEGEQSSLESPVRSPHRHLMAKMSPGVAADLDYDDSSVDFQHSVDFQDSLDIDEIDLLHVDRRQSLGDKMTL